MTNGVTEAGEASLRAISDYETGRCTKADAVKRILSAYSELEDINLGECVQPQLHLLDEVEEQHKAAKAAGKSTQRPNGNAEGSSNNRVPSTLAEESVDDDDDDDDSGTDTKEETGRRKDAPRLESGVWVFPGLSGLAEDRDIRKTQDLVRAYANDLPGARSAIMGAAGAPVLAESVWTSILKHGFVDFNKINGGNYSAVTEEDGADASIGEYVIKLKTRSVTNPVVNFMDWSFCWESYSRGVGIAFPHRRTELHAYGDKIKLLFKGFRTERHALVLNLDRAMRTQVANNYRIKLTDDVTFAALSHQYLSPHGSGYLIYADSAATTPKRTPKLDEACRQWNANRCARPASVCKYKHHCSECRGSHAALECPKTTSGTGGRAGNRKGATV